MQSFIIGSKFGGDKLVQCNTLVKKVNNTNNCIMEKFMCQLLKHVVILDDLPFGSTLVLIVCMCVCACVYREKLLLPVYFMLLLYASIAKLCMAGLAWYSNIEHACKCNEFNLLM